MSYLMVLGGLFLLFIGGEGLVRGAVSIARRLNISELAIGLTLVGFGTSVPELVTSIQAIQRDAVGIAIGNVVGSNVANVLLVLALAVLMRPILVNRSAIARDAAVMVSATLLLCALLWFDQFGRLAGLILVGLLLLYIVFSLVADRNRADPAAQMHAAEGETVAANFPLAFGLLVALAGLVGVVIGANLLVEGSVTIAREFGLSEAVIGLTIVAVGTSLPELATSIVAAIRGRGDVALGNVIGSNIFNILGILGITALVHPFSVRGDIGAEAMAGGQPTSILTSTDIGALLLSVFLLILFATTGRKLSRWEGGLLLAGYGIYMGLTFNLIPMAPLIPNVG